MSITQPFRRRHLILAAMLVPALVSRAQQPSPNRLPTVTITGESPRALSTSVLDFPPIETTQIRQAEDLSSRAPNFFVSSASLHSFGDIYTIRGLGNTPFFSSPGVALYVDDVPAGDAFSFSTPLYDVDQVEIFRGPQPHRFGLNSEAGVIDIRTRRAGDVWHGSASGSYGTYDSQDYRLSLSGPLVKDKLSLSLSGLWSLSDGFIDNTFLRRKTDDRDTLAGRAVLTWTPAPGLEITAGFEGGRSHDGSQRIVKLSGDPYQVSSDVEGSLNLHQHTEWLKIGKSFDTWKVMSITSHAQWEIDPAIVDLDLTPARADFAGFFPGVNPFPSGARSEIRRKQETWSQEIRFESLPPALAEPGGKPDGTGGVKSAPASREYLRWQAGLFFQNKDTDGNDLRSFSAPFPVPGPFTIYTALNQRTTYSQNEENWAAYANVGRAFGRLDVEVGIRLDYTRKTIDRVKDDGLGGNIRISGEYDDWTAAPSLGLTYRVNDNLDLFARTTYGFKPGGFSAYADNPALARYGRETVWATEAGVRGRVLDGRLRGSITGYYNHIDNYQVERTFSFTDYFIANADRAESLGAELELSAELVQGLTLSGSVGYNQTQLLGYRDPITGADLSHNEAPFVPNFTALAALDYAHDCGFRARLEYVVIGDVQYTDTNASRYRQAAYGLLNARIGFEQAHWGVYLFGRNLADKEYFTLKQSDIDAGVRGEPRILGVMAQLKF